MKEWEWYTVPHMVHLFMHIVSEANHKPGEWRGITYKRGQLITGTHKLAEETGLSRQIVRTCIERLKSTSEITTHSTNQYTIITVIGYDKYQESVNSQPAIQPTTQPTVNQRLTNDQPHNKNVKNEKNEKNSTVGIEKEIIKHLSRQEGIGSPTGYYASLKAKVSIPAIETAWKEWKRGSGIESTGDFWQRCLYWHKELASNKLPKV